MKEFSRLLGKLLIEKQNRDYLIQLIHARNDGSEAITVNAIFNKNIDQVELKLLSRTNKFSKQNLLFKSFRKSIVHLVINNAYDYPILNSKLIENKKAKIGARTIDDIYDELSEFYSSQGLDVYFPYEENFALENESVITLTWDPLTGQDWNSGYELSNKDGFAIEPIATISDNYAYSYPTLVVRPSSGFDGYELIDPNPNPIINAVNPPSWAFQGWQGFLTFNVDHTKIMEADVLKVSVPKIRLLEHLGTFLTPTTITIVRSSANLVTDNNSNLVFPLGSDSKMLVYKKHIKRKDARNHNWVDVNILWDDDWNMSEADHNFTWASHHTFSGSLTASGNVKLGYDVTTNKVTFEPKIDVAFSVKVGNNCKLRYNNNISRRAVLTQIVGDTGAGTYNDNGTEYSIRTADKMEYYFKPYLTKIIQ